MSRRTESSSTRLEEAAGRCQPVERLTGPESDRAFHRAGAFTPGDDSRMFSDGDIIQKISRLTETMNRDAQFVKRIAEFAGTTLVLSATDTGRELAIVLDGQEVRVHPYVGGSCDAKIRATEEVHWAVLSGRMDPDTAFFAGKVHISGSVVTAFRVKNRLLGHLQQHLARVGGV